MEGTYIWASFKYKTSNNGALLLFNWEEALLNYTILIDGELFEAGDNRNQSFS